MTNDQITIITGLVAVMALFLWGRWRHDMVAMGGLLVCVVGFVDVLGFAVANAAHVGGLLSGAVLGALFALAHRPTD
mgnify:CR=1 FL=1